MSPYLTIHEVGMRDGLQLESTFIHTERKWELSRTLVEAGLRRIELSSFVSPRAVPQMSDAPALFERTRSNPDAAYTALVVNEKGYDRAIASGAKSVAAVLVPSETLSLRNSRKTASQARDFIRYLLKRAKEDQIWTRVYLAVAWVCPFEGAMPSRRILDLAKQVNDWGADEIALADTIGHAHPLEVGRLCESVGTAIGMEKLAVHLHDTLAMGLANAAAAMTAGVRIIDSSFGGLGGCPFAPGSRGNLATEDLVLMANKMGFETGVSLAKLYEAIRMVEEDLCKPLGGRTQNWWIQNQAEQLQQVKTA